MKHEHTREAIHRRLAAAPEQSYLRDWAYGGIGGTATKFALVAGVVGAHLAPRIILIPGRRQFDCRRFRDGGGELPGYPGGG